MSGIYNAVSPNIITNEEFTKEFAKNLRRPIMWHIPAWLVKLIVRPDRAGYSLTLLAYLLYFIYLTFLCIFYFRYCIGRATRNTETYH